MFDLKGQVAVITGASSGLGRQMAYAFAAQGASLVVLARRIDRLEELEDLQNVYHTMDITDEIAAALEEE